MELRKFFNLFWRRKLILLITTLVTVIAAGIGTRYMTPLYKASTVLRVAVSTSGMLNYQDYLYTDRLMNTYVEIAQSEPVAQELSMRLLLARRPAIAVRIIPNTELIEVTVKDTNPTLAAKEANTLAEILIAQENQLYTGGGKKTTDVLQAQLSTVQADMEQTRQEYERLLAQTPPAPDNAEATRELLSLKQTNYASLLAQYEQARFREEIQASMVTVWQTADVPQEPSSPNPLLNYALGIIVGLLGGMGLVVAFENVDTTLYSTADIEAATGRTALARIPRGNKKQISYLQRDFSPMAEAFRNLGTMLHQRHGGDTGKAVLVMSAQPSQGKSTVVCHLAASLAEIGKSIIVVDCDTRIPRLHTLFRIPNDCGLVEVLEGKIPVEEAIRGTFYEGVNALTSGSPPLHPAQVLGSPQMNKLIALLKRRYDYVLLDSPALLAVADVAALRPHADFLIMVVRRGHARREAMRAAGNFLGEANTQPVYLIVNYAESSDSYGYYQYRPKSSSLSVPLEETLTPGKRPEEQQVAEPHKEPA